MPDIQDVERIQFKMQRIRRHMDEDVNRLQADAAQLMDWKYYILRHPVASLAGVVAVGYLLVPKPRKATETKVYLDPDVSREALADNGKIEIDQREEVAQQSILTTLATLAVSTLAKSAVSYAGQQIRSSFLQDFLQPAQETAARRHHDSRREVD